MAMVDQWEEKNIYDSVGTAALSDCLLLGNESPRDNYDSYKSRPFHLSTLTDPHFSGPRRFDEFKRIKASTVVILGPLGELFNDIFIDLKLLERKRETYRKLFTISHRPFSILVTPSSGFLCSSLSHVFTTERRSMAPSTL